MKAPLFARPLDLNIEPPVAKTPEERKAFRLAECAALFLTVRSQHGSNSRITEKHRGRLVAAMADIAEEFGIDGHEQLRREIPQFDGRHCHYDR